MEVEDSTVPRDGKLTTHLKCSLPTENDAPIPTVGEELFFSNIYHKTNAAIGSLHKHQCYVAGHHSVDLDRQRLQHTEDLKTLLSLY